MSTKILRDQQHAARLFVDDHFRLAPKHKFLFHVSFSINQAACKNIGLVQRHRNEINMLVKAADLPSFNIKVETLNQYNRKKNVQTVHEYNPISITFHDDNMGLINQVWQNYYNYYYADPSSAVDPGAYDRTAMKKFSYIRNTYGLDNGSKAPFFNYIKIYQMARKEFVCYQLHNPIISRWNHNKVAYSQDDLHDNLMEVRFEAVSYTNGKVSAGTPEGFGTEHYDQTPSPNKGRVSGGSGSSTVLAGSASPSFSGSTKNNAKEFISNLTTSINTYQNTSLLPIGGNNITPPNLTVNGSIPGVNGLQNIAFPIANIPNPTIAAVPVNLG